MKVIKAFVHHARAPTLVQALVDAGYRNITLQDVKGMLKPLGEYEQDYSQGRPLAGDIASRKPRAVRVAPHAASNGVRPACMPPTVGCTSRLQWCGSQSDSGAHCDGVHADVLYVGAVTRFFGMRAGFDDAAAFETGSALGRSGSSKRAFAARSDSMNAVAMRDGRRCSGVHRM